MFEQLIFSMFPAHLPLVFVCRHGVGGAMLLVHFTSVNDRLFLSLVADVVGRPSVCLGRSFPAFPTLIGSLEFLPRIQLWLRPLGGPGELNLILSGRFD